MDGYRNGATTPGEVFVDAPTSPLPDSDPRIQQTNGINGTNGTYMTNGAHQANGAEQTSGMNEAHGVGQGPQVVSTSSAVEVLCGPLLNYKRMTASTWYGSVLIVTTPGQQDPQLRLRCTGPVAGANSGAPANSNTTSFPATKLYEDPKAGFWRFQIEVPYQDFEARWEYQIMNMKKRSGKGPMEGGLKGGDDAEHETSGHGPSSFAVPSRDQSMRIMFHSCNGFSVGTDVDAWSGPALWNDVMRMHAKKPFHVMIGGGDQIYNDGVRVDGPLKPWTAIGNPEKRRKFPFDEKMRADCDEYYFNNYVRWYSTEPFAAANSQIAQLNIWDDHDIIDGFGSYTDHFMRCHVFRGIGGVAHKYYLLFQHHIAPPKSTYTTDAPQTMHNEHGTTTAVDSKQLQDAFVYTEPSADPSFIIGKKPGPYVEERSISLYCQLGARIAFCGIDARTERTRHQINYPETYDLIFQRLEREFQTNKNLKHFILLLGVPIAYPRLQWLENLLRSPLIAPVKLLNKRFGFAGGVFNQFDGSVDLLDDLDDHYTAHQHKKERKMLINRLQALAKQHSIRVTILGGDVHLGAIGRFYSNPKLNIPAEKDWRYIPNIISSAITNKPPPQPVANLLARRNKIHHLDHDTDETLLEIFDKQPGGKAKAAASNHATMPSRNYAIIAESRDTASTLSNHTDMNGGPVQSNGANGVSQADGHITSDQPDRAGAMHHNRGSKGTNPRHPIHSGEDNAGVSHPAASGIKATGLCGSYGLDVTLRVEIDQSDREGHTDGYGFSVPGLEAGGYVDQGKTW